MKQLQARCLRFGLAEFDLESGFTLQKKKKGEGVGVVTMRSHNAHTQWIHCGCVTGHNVACIRSSHRTAVLEVCAANVGSEMQRCMQLGMANPGIVGMQLLRDRCCRRALRSLLAALRNSAFEIVSDNCIVSIDNVKNGSRHCESHLLRWMRLLPQVYGHQESSRRRFSRKGAYAAFVDPSFIAFLNLGIRR